MYKNAEQVQLIQIIADLSDFERVFIVEVQTTGTSVIKMLNWRWWCFNSNIDQCDIYI